MGKKYIIELEDKPFHKEDGDFLYRVKGFNSLVFDMTGIGKLTPYTEPDLEQVRKEAYQKGYETGYEDGYNEPGKNQQEAYQRGLNDAWDAARKIVIGDINFIGSAFGSGTRSGIIRDLTASEVIKVLKDYEQEQDAEIKVGDEVIPRETEYDTMIVTRLWKDDYDSDCIDAIGFDGRISSFLVSRVSKTGKHYEIAAVLEKMRGEQDG